MRRPTWTLWLCLLLGVAVAGCGVGAGTGSSVRQPAAGATVTATAVTVAPLIEATARAESTRLAALPAQDAPKPTVTPVKSAPTAQKPTPTAGQPSGNDAAVQTEIRNLIVAADAFKTRGDVAGYLSTVATHSPEREAIQFSMTLIISKLGIDIMYATESMAFLSIQPTQAVVQVVKTVRALGKAAAGWHDFRETSETTFVIEAGHWRYWSTKPLKTESLS